MTNADWIRSMTDEELAIEVLNSCDGRATCAGCPWKDARGKCVFESGKGMAMEWLEMERGG